MWNINRFVDMVLCVPKLAPSPSVGCRQKAISVAPFLQRVVTTNKRPAPSESSLPRGAGVQIQNSTS